MPCMLPTWSPDTLQGGGMLLGQDQPSRPEKSLIANAMKAQYRCEI